MVLDGQVVYQLCKAASTVLNVSEFLNPIGPALGLNSCLVRLAGIEPTTLGFGGQYSIH